MSKKILLTSVCRPMGPKYGDAPSVGYELLYRQVTRAQGIFSPRTVNIHFSLEYIAENLDAPTVVLQYPSKRELIRELKKGYDYVGISFPHGGHAQDEGDGRLDPPIRAAEQDRPRRLRHRAEGRGAQALRGLHLPGGRRRVLSPAAGRTGNPDALQAPADRELAEGIWLEGVGHGENFRRARVSQRLRFLLHVALSSRASTSSCCRKAKTSTPSSSVTSTWTPTWSS